MMIVAALRPPPEPPSLTLHATTGRAKQSSPRQKTRSSRKRGARSTWMTGTYTVKLLQTPTKIKGFQRFSQCTYNTGEREGEGGATLSGRKLDCVLHAAVVSLLSRAWRVRLTTRMGGRCLPIPSSLVAAFRARRRSHSQACQPEPSLPCDFNGRMAIVDWRLVHR